MDLNIEPQSSDHQESSFHVDPESNRCDVVEFSDKHSMDPDFMPFEKDIRVRLFPPDNLNSGSSRSSDTSSIKWEGLFPLQSNDGSSGEVEAIHDRSLVQPSSIEFPQNLSRAIDKSTMYEPNMALKVDLNASVEDNMLLDLNSNSSLCWVSQSQGSSDPANPVICCPTRPRQVPFSQRSNDGSFSLPIEIGDDVQPRQQLRRSEPVIIILDDDMGPSFVQSGVISEEPDTTLTLNLNYKREIFPCLNSGDDCDTKSKCEAGPERLVAITREPTITCPICKKSIADPWTTKCGHLFCESCIRTSLQQRKKCPTCMKKIKIDSIHRLYLSSATRE